MRGVKKINGVERSLKLSSSLILTLLTVYYFLISKLALLYNSVTLIFCG